MEVITVGAIVGHLDAWAPEASAQSYDNPGLQVGDPGAAVTRALVALDATPAVLDEARALGAELVVTHHPLIFRPLKSVTPGGFVSGLVYRFARHGVALACAHTNLDAARDGVSFALAAQLGLAEVRFLQPARDTRYKLVTFVPESHLAAVQEALAAAGTGRIGSYEACAFTSPGTGHFRAGTDARPFVGAAGGELESVPEIRLEVEVPRWALHAATNALVSAHPYEQPAFDVYPIQQPNTLLGMGAVGRLPQPMSLSGFLTRVRDTLDAGALRYAGDPEAMVRTVAVCGGSGSDLVSEARQAGADALVTADVTYHRFFDVLDPRGIPSMALIDAGHYETERITEQLLTDRLQKAFPSVTFQRTHTRTSPMMTWTNQSSR